MLGPMGRRISSPGSACLESGWRLLKSSCAEAICNADPTEPSGRRTTETVHTTRADDSATPGHRVSENVCQLPVARRHELRSGPRLEQGVCARAQRAHDHGGEERGASAHSPARRTLRRTPAKLTMAPRLAGALCWLAAFAYDGAFRSRFAHRDMERERWRDCSEASGVARVSEHLRSSKYMHMNTRLLVVLRMSMCLPGCCLRCIRRFVVSVWLRWRCAQAHSGRFSNPGELPDNSQFVARRSAIWRATSCS